VGNISWTTRARNNYDTNLCGGGIAADQGLLWAGTDDGLVQLTQDEGKTWTNVTPKDMPEWARVSQIDASSHDAGNSLCGGGPASSFDDLRPYIYKTADYGKTWTKIATGIPDTTFVRAVREDPKKRGLLYAGRAGRLCFVQ